MIILHNNIFINITEEAALKLDKNYFLEQLKNRLKQEFSPVSYDLIYKDATIEKQKYTFILFIKQINMVLAGKDFFISALKKTILFCLDIKE